MVQSLALFERAGSEYTLNGTTAGVQSLVKVSWISGSRYVAVWTHDADGAGPIQTEIRAQIFEANGTPVGAEFTVNTGESGDQTNAVVAKLAGGGFVVAFEDRQPFSDGSGSSIRYQVYGADGAPIGQSRLANLTMNLDQSRPSVAGLEGGGFVITWTDASQSGGDTAGAAVRGQLFTAAGDLSGTEFLVNTITFRDQSDSNVVALAGGGFAVLWEDASPQGVFNGSVSREDLGTDIAIQIFSSSASKVGPQRVVDSMTPPPTYVFGDGNGTVTAQDPVAVLLEGGAIAVAWRDFDGYVKTRLLNADGTPSTAVFNVGDWSGTGHPAPAIVALADGGYAVSWTTNGDGLPDGSGSGILTRVFGADGSPQGVEFQANSTTAGNQLGSTMLAFEDGGFLVAWQDGGSTDLSAQRFRSDPGSIGDIALSVGSISRAAIENVQAAILSADGALNAPFTFQLVSDPTGAFRIEGDRLVVADTALLYNYGADQATITFLATDPNGNSFQESIVIPLTAAPASALFEAGSEVAVTVPSPTSSAQTPEITALPDGGWFLTWVEHTGSGLYDVKGQFYEADGSAGAQLVLNTLTAGSQFAPLATLLENGNLVVTWAGPAQQSPTFGTMLDIRAQILDPSGAKIGAEFVVNTTTAQNQTRSVPVALADGGFLVTWADSIVAGSNVDIKAQFFASNGTKVGSEFTVNTTTTAGVQTDPYAAQLDNGTIVIAWGDSSLMGGDPSSSSVRARLYSAAGVPIGTEFLVNSTTLHSQSAPVVTALADGRFVIVWGDTSEGTGSTGTFDPADIRAQIFDSAGNKVGGEILVNSETTGFQGQGSLGIAGVAADPDGGFVVSWATTFQSNADGDQASVKAQLFGPDGGKIGSEFLVNQDGTGHQSTPAVAYLGDGDLVFAYWDVTPRIGDNRGISMRRFDSAVQSTLPNPIEGTPGNDVLVGTSGADSISGKVGLDRLSGLGGDDILRGDDGDDILAGDGGNDEIYGGSGDDLLDGGTGVDRTRGGLGNDVHHVDNVGDLVVELLNEGADTVATSINYTLTANVENLQALNIGGSDPLILTGNGLANFIWGTQGNNAIDGGGGADFMIGYAGNDFYHVDHVSDIAYELEGGGADTVATVISYTLAANIENLQSANIGGTAALALTGNAMNNFIWGTQGNNILDGGAGADFLIGYAGDDIYHVDNVSDIAYELEGGGSDTAVASISYTLAANVENLQALNIAGTAPLALTGNAMNNFIWGTQGNNVIDGAGGADFMIGYGGNDFYFADNAGDVTIEEAGGGEDTVAALASYALGANIENLQAANIGGTAALSLTGNEQGNFIWGTQGSNVIAGRGGNDRIYGYGGADQFLFNTAAGNANFDWLDDFQAGVDKIVLDNSVFTALADGALPASAFVTGTSAADADDRIIFDSATGSIFYDADGNGAGSALLVAIVPVGQALTAADFLTV